VSGAGEGRTLILGTAGHIDHGKTTLIRALTGVDTDRLAEEKARGITIDLGFAELAEGGVRFGVVDVPGHEGFVRNMLAGATGMDAAIVVVAADEGVMPQTREHVAILDLLGVRRVVVALTRSDVADPEWADLVAEEVSELLGSTTFADAPIVRTAVPPEGEPAGLEALRGALVKVAEGVARDAGDLVLLPIDRVFTVRGTGTVVTGSLVSGTLEVGDTVAVLPGTRRARVRGIQMHGRDADVAAPGARVAVALGGGDVDSDALSRGQALVTQEGWEASRMLTVRVRVLRGTGWELSERQRVHVHIGTKEVMARCVLLSPEKGELRERLAPGEEGWVQLRLEAPAVARVGMRLVLRSWSPVTTIAGGTVAEVYPPKRHGREALERLEARLAADPVVRADAALQAAGGEGVSRAELPVRAGVAPAVLTGVVEALLEAGAVTAPDGRIFSVRAADRAAARMLAVVDATHRDEPFRRGVGLPLVRAAVPAGSHPELADAVLAREGARGELEVVEGVVRRVGFEATLSTAQLALRDRLAALHAEAGLEPPRFGDLPPEVVDDPAFHTVLRELESDGVLIVLDDDLRIDAAAFEAAIARVRDAFTGRDGLGPADFREVIPVSRRWLLPILQGMDRRGVTRFDGSGRSVPQKGAD